MKQAILLLEIETGGGIAGATRSKARGNVVDIFYLTSFGARRIAQTLLAAVLLPFLTRSA